MKKLLFLFSFVAMLSLAWHGANAGPPDDVGTSQVVVVCLSDFEPAPVANYAIEAVADLVYERPEGIYIVYAAPTGISQYAYIIDKRILLPPDNCTNLIVNYKSYLMPFDRPPFWPLHFV